MADQDDTVQEPAAEQAPTSGEEESRSDRLDTPSPSGGPAVTPTGTSEGAADTSVFEGPGDEPADGGDQDRLQSADEDTFPPSG